MLGEPAARFEQASSSSQMRALPDLSYAGSTVTRPITSKHDRRGDRPQLPSSSPLTSGRPAHRPTKPLSTPPAPGIEDAGGRLPISRRCHREVGAIPPSLSCRSVDHTRRHQGDPSDKSDWGSNRSTDTKEYVQRSHPSDVATGISNRLARKRELFGSNIKG